MSVYKQLTPNDIKTSKSFLSQLVDVLQEDVSASVSRQKYQNFVTGSVGPGVTSSLYQTVYDQDFSLQTANPIFDITVGLFYDSDTVNNSSTGTDSAGKMLFPSSSLMMREKINIYNQFASSLLGGSTEQFYAPFDSTTASDKIDEALFLCFKRLFARDQIKPETLAIKFYETASINYNSTGTTPSETTPQRPNLAITSTSGSAIYTDIGSATNNLSSYGGQVGNIVDSSDTDRTVGLVFYDRGIVVLDLAKVTSGSQFVSGTIDAMHSLGTTVLGSAGTETQYVSKFIPDFLVSASMDNILDHIASARFGSGSSTSCTFQNVTKINSSLIFCRAAADEFNYSSNPTYVDSESKIKVIDSGQENNQTSFTFITTVVLYDANNNALAVGKLSRPVEKNNERDLTLRVRLDY